MCDGVFWLNPTETWVDIGPIQYSESKGSKARFLSEGGFIDIFLVSGSPKDVINTFTKLTGRPQLVPQFALGFHQSQGNYITDDKIFNVTESLDNIQVPFESIWLGYDITKNIFFNTDKLVENSKVKISYTGKFFQDASHEVYVDTILNTIREAAKVRGTGIAERTHEYVATKMKEGKAIIALCGDEFAGFTYIESWGNKEYVATSGLIVHPKYRGQGLAKRIKHASFTLARLRWPKAKIFSLTSGAAVMKMNTELGYVPVTFNELTDDEAFWRGCEGCINHEILMAKNRKFCICTAMLYDPALHKDDKVTNF